MRIVASNSKTVIKNNRNLYRLKINFWLRTRIYSVKNSWTGKWKIYFRMLSFMNSTVSYKTIPKVGGRS